MKKISGNLRHLPWKQLGILILLMIFELSMHPLGVGPDRRIHDPGVVRFIDPKSSPGDWYTDAAQASGVYPFYGALVSLGPTFSIEEERWRMILYIISLVVLYIALFRIARIFSDNILVVPLVAVFHATGYLYDPPAWLYGPFMHIDGGLAPRSIGVALSFLAVAFFLEERKIAPWIVIGIATLIHVSNSMLVFLVLLATTVLEQLVEMYRRCRQMQPRVAVKQGFPFTQLIIPISVYFLSGGWFILAVASHDVVGPMRLTTEQFIWTWVYFRAPYMALPYISYGSWILFSLYLLVLAGAMTFLFWFLREKRKELSRLGLISFFSLMGFVVFYLVTFEVPWLKGFQLYSFRIIYLVYLSMYVSLAIVIVTLPRYLINRFPFFQTQLSLWKWIYILVIGGTYLFFVNHYKVIDRYEGKAIPNLEKSIEYFKKPQMPAAGSPIEKYLFDHRAVPYLSPPDWNGPPRHASVASFKVFGFTQSSLPIWRDRMDALSRGELSRQYYLQKSQGRFKPVIIDWRETYGKLTAEEVESLRKKWGFRYFVTYIDHQSYPYHVIMMDEKYILYDVDEISM